MRFKGFSFLMLTNYLKCVVGMDGANECRMKQTAILIGIIGFPFLSIGDFNMTSGELLATGWPQYLHATTMNISDGTSTLRHHDDRLIDFFMLSTSMVGMVAYFGLYLEFPCTPHYACKLSLHGAPAAVVEPMWRIPQPLPLTDFKLFWKNASEPARTTLINNAQQKADALLSTQGAKSGIPFLASPLRRLLKTP